MRNPFSVDGKVVLVTGGGTGIGAIIAREFAVRGARTLIASRNAEEIAWPCLFFAADASSFVTGQTLSVDGGPASSLFIQGRG